MNRKRIANVIENEWRTSFLDLNTAITVLGVPILLAGQLLLYIWIGVSITGGSVPEVSVIQNALANLKSVTPAVASLSASDQFRVLLLSQFTFYMLLIPVIIAVSLATYSIVDEKISGSLEALLATPVRTNELLLRISVKVIT